MRIVVGQQAVNGVIVMNLYEFRTGYEGDAYERCYVWAASRDRAEKLFKDKYPDKPIKGVKWLQNSNDPEYVTSLSTEGWEM